MLLFEITKSSNHESQMSRQTVRFRFATRFSDQSFFYGRLCGLKSRITNVRAWRQAPNVRGLVRTFSSDIPDSRFVHDFVNLGRGIVDRGSWIVDPRSSIRMKFQHVRPPILVIEGKRYGSAERIGNSTVRSNLALVCFFLRLMLRSDHLFVCVRLSV